MNIHLSSFNIDPLLTQEVETMQANNFQVYSSLPHFFFSLLLPSDVIQALALEKKFLLFIKKV